MQISLFKNHDEFISGLLKRPDLTEALLTQKLIAHCDGSKIKSKGDLAKIMVALNISLS